MTKSRRPETLLLASTMLRYTNLMLKAQQIFIIGNKTTKRCVQFVYLEVLTHVSLGHPMLNKKKAKKVKYRFILVC